MNEYQNPSASFRKSLIIMRFFLVCLVLILAMAGCQSKRSTAMSVNIALYNNSTNALDQVELSWEGPHVSAGILSPGISSVTLDVEWPNVASAKLNFIDAETHQPYSIELSLSEVKKQISLGKCGTVVVRISSYDKAEVVCKEGDVWR